MIPLEKVASLKLKFKEGCEVLAMAWTIGCGLFLLGFYGVEGNFGSKKEQTNFYIVIISGFACIGIIALRRGVDIQRDIIRDSVSGAMVIATPSPPQQVQSAQPAQRERLTELSSFWVAIGVTATTTIIIFVILIHLPRVWMEDEFVIKVSSESLFSLYERATLKFASQRASLVAVDPGFRHDVPIAHPSCDRGLHFSDLRAA